MDSSRTRHSRVSQPRHVPRIRPEATSTFTAPLSDIDNYALVSAPQDYCSVIEPCWPSMIDTFPPGNDSAYIPAQMVNPAELMNQTWDMMSNTDVESSYTSSSGSSTKSTACISPPMSEAETLSAELYQPTVHTGMDHFPSYKDTLTQTMIWPLTPPTEPWEDVELFSSGKNDQMGFSRLPESAITECEYIGPSKLQFSRSSHRLSRVPEIVLTVAQCSSPSSSAETPSICFGTEPRQFGLWIPQGRTTGKNQEQPKE